MTQAEQDEISRKTSIEALKQISHQDEVIGAVVLIDYADGSQAQHKLTVDKAAKREALS